MESEGNRSRYADRLEWIFRRWVGLSEDMAQCWYCEGTIDVPAAGAGGRINGAVGIIGEQGEPVQLGLGPATASVEGNLKSPAPNATGKAAECGHRVVSHGRREEHRLRRSDPKDNRGAARWKERTTAT